MTRHREVALLAIHTMIKMRVDPDAQRSHARGGAA
jgi:hypothetical protein